MKSLVVVVFLLTVGVVQGFGPLMSHNAVGAAERSFVQEGADDEKGAYRFEYAYLSVV